MNRIRKRLTYANVMSSLAVFLVLGGATAFAATKIGTNEIQANAITTGKIKKEAVAQGKIKAGAVGNSRLANGSVTANKLTPNAVTGSTLADNSVTSSKLAENSVISGKIANAAVTSAKLANGAVTAAQLGQVTVQTESVAVANNLNGSANVVCPPGQRVISGGGAWSSFTKGLEFLSTRPIKSLADVEPMANNEVPTGWRASGLNNNSGISANIIVWVLCLN